MDLIFATHNKNKFLEVQKQLPPHIKLNSLTGLGYFEEIPEPFETLEENAAQKATIIFNAFNKNCFSDDTGLFVNSLGGAPGVYSARYAGPKADGVKNIEKLLKTLHGTANRAAYFKTIIVLKTLTSYHYFEGIIEGHIAKEPKGNGGFGYDSVFIPEGYTKTFAQLTPATKQEIGHRGKAIEKLIGFLKQ